MDLSAEYDSVIAKLDSIGELKNVTVRVYTHTGGNIFTGDTGTESYTDYTTRAFGQEITNLIELFGLEYNEGNVAIEILKEGTLTTLSEKNTLVIMDNNIYEILKEPISFSIGGVHKSWFCIMSRRF